MTSIEFIQIITGFIGSLGFAMLFNIRGKKLLFAGLGGLFSWTLFVLLEPLLSSEPIRYFIVATCVSVYSEVLARLLKTPTTTFITTSLIPLIPGGSLYYTMKNAFEGNIETFISNGIITLKLAVALALGVVITTAMTNLLLKSIHRIKCFKNSQNILKSS